MICYRYDCPICGKIIFGRKNMFRHSKEEHDNVAAHRCTCCRRLFSSKEELSQHQDGHCTIRSRKVNEISDYDVISNLQNITFISNEKFELIIYANH